MPLGTALSSGLQAFTAVRGEQRKAQLHNLQTEGLSLRNEGQRLANRFETDTYDDRIRHTRRTADNTDAIASVNEWKLMYEQDTYDMRVDQQRHNTRNAANNANNSGYIAGQNALKLDSMGRTHETGITATNAQNQAITAESRGRVQQANQQYFTRALTPILASSQTPDELFHNPEAMGAYAQEAENVYGDELRAEYGDSARILAPIYENGMVTILIDENGDGSPDLAGRQVPLDQFLMEAHGEDRGRQEFLRLTQNEDYVRSIQAQGEQRMASDEEGLQTAQGNVERLQGQSDTVGYYNQQLAELEAERAELQQSGGFGGDVGEYGVTSPLAPRMQNNDRIDEIDATIANLREGAAALGVTDYLGNQNRFDAALAHDQEQVDRLSSRLEQTPQQTQQQTQRALSQFNRGIRPEQLQEQHAESRQRFADYVAESDTKVNIASLLTRMNDGKAEVDPAQVERLNISKKSWLNDNAAYVTEKLEHGADGERVMDELVRTATLIAVDTNQPFHSAADQLIGEHPELVTDILAFRGSLDNSQTLKNVASDMTDGQRNRLIDRAAQHYARIRMENPNLSEAGVRRRAQDEAGF